MAHDRNDVELQSIAEISNENPEWGFGIHLWLTNEYQENCEWKTVLPQGEVPSLYNNKGLSCETIAEVEQYVDPKHAVLELEAQIRKAIDVGIKLPRIDSHMGTVYRASRFPGAHPDCLRRAAITVAEKYRLPMTANTFDKDSAASIERVKRHGEPDGIQGEQDLEQGHHGISGASVCGTRQIIPETNAASTLILNVALF